jgi:hypothetical protein
MLNVMWEVSSGVIAVRLFLLQVSLSMWEVKLHLSVYLQLLLVMLPVAVVVLLFWSVALACFVVRS